MEMVEGSSGISRGSRIGNLLCDPGPVNLTSLILSFPVCHGDTWEGLPAKCHEEAPGTQQVLN